MNRFDCQPTLVGDTLRIAPMRGTDITGLVAAASDPGIWAQHPKPDRHLARVSQPYFESLLESGTSVTVWQADRDQIIGCSRYYTSPDARNDIAIGYTFLVRAHWGGGSNRELKTLMLTHAFRWHERVWFHIDPRNTRSLRAAAKIGARHVGQANLDFGAGIRSCERFVLRRADWHSAQMPEQPEYGNTRPSEG